MSAENTSKTILIAEDSSVILNLTRKILEQQKYKILLAKNGGDVLPQLEKNTVDGILMDINIPVKDGMQCTRDIRAHADERIRSLPVIAI
ncbi:MAG: response regulator, partial [Cytophagaceae bacterium]